MRAAVYYRNSDVRLEEAPLPAIGPGEMLLRVEASGICGSDVLEWYRVHRAPLILGHEIAGVVEAVGPAPSGSSASTMVSSEWPPFQVGERVIAAHHVPCNRCHYCLTGRHTVCDTLRATNFDPGGFVEYLRLPAINVELGTFRIPDSVSFEDATFVEPLACVLRGQRKLGIEAGQSVLILGGGVSGLLHLLLAKALGAGKVFVTDVVESRLELARRCGADAALRADTDIPTTVRELTDGRGADSAIICTGAAPAVEQALLSIDRGGSVLWFAPTREDFTIPVPANQIFWRNEAKLVSTYAADPSEHATALELIRSGRVDVNPLITHRLPLAGTGEGFRLVAEAGDSLKVIVFPQS